MENKTSIITLFLVDDEARNKENRSVVSTQKSSILLQCKSGVCNKFLRCIFHGYSPVAVNAMEITTDADFYWTSEELMNVSLQSYRRKEGFYAVLGYIKALERLATWATKEEDHEYIYKAATSVM